MRLRAAEVAEAVNGVCHGPNVEIDGVSIDSRTLRGGELFVPVRGERDGHHFIRAASAAGARAYLTERAPVTESPATAIAVAGTEAALMRLGAFGRSRVSDRVIGITGSSGKTTTKDLLAAVLSTTYRTTASQRSFNNELGVPLTVLNAPDNTEALVVEMGARGPGHVRRLCDLARPALGIVTNVSAAHTATFGSVDDVAVAKRELVEALPAAGIAVLNADDPRVAAMAPHTQARPLTFGLGAGADVGARDVSLDGDLRAGFELVSPWGEAPVRLGVRGQHQVANALAAAAAGLALGVVLPSVVRGLEQAQASGGRMELSSTASGARVLNDSYNANPASMEAGLRALAALEADRRTAVLGPMLELGDLSDDEHARIGRLALELGIDRVISVAAPAYGVGEAVADVPAARRAMGRLGAGDAILVKASRAAGLDELVALLTEGAG